MEGCKENNNVLNSCELLNLSYLASLNLLWAHQAFVCGFISKVRRSTKPHITSPRSRSPKLGHLERGPHINVTWFNVSKIEVRRSAKPPIKNVTSIHIPKWPPTWFPEYIRIFIYGARTTTTNVRIQVH
jgi:hypothetical protein